MSKTPRKRRQRGQLVSSRSISVMDKWWSRAEAAVTRGQARTVSHFFELVCEQAEQVGISVIDAVNDIGVPDRPKAA